MSKFPRASQHSQGLNPTNTPSSVQLSPGRPGAPWDSATGPPALQLAPAGEVPAARFTHPCSWRSARGSLHRSRETASSVFRKRSVRGAVLLGWQQGELLLTSIWEPGLTDGGLTVTLKMELRRSGIEQEEAGLLALPCTRPFRRRQLGAGLRASPPHCPARPGDSDSCVRCLITWLRLQFWGQDH